MFCSVNGKLHRLGFDDVKKFVVRRRSASLCSLLTCVRTVVMRGPAGRAQFNAETACLEIVMVEDEGELCLPPPRSLCRPHVADCVFPCAFVVGRSQHPPGASSFMTLRR